MDQVCPLSFKSIDATTVRIVSLFMFALTALMIWSESLVLALLLVLDFMIRLYVSRSYSPLFWFAGRLQYFLKLSPRYEDAAAKRLAAHFGLLFMLLFALLIAQQQWLWLYGVAALFFTCSALEVLFGYCIGCKIYHLYVLLKKAL
ncbi:MAG: DUF4395 family protein [Campylobacterales bacterium]|nr:DUF4395 family protein [Campylobacterales bacterium]